MFGGADTVALMKRDAKINVMLTTEEVRALEDELAARRQRSISTLARELLAAGAKAKGIRWPEDEEDE